MKVTATRELFYRKQTIANLRAVFRKDVEVLTCQFGSRTVALACTLEADGGRTEVMQSSSLELTNALRDLHNLSSNCVRTYFADHDYQISKDELAACSIDLPRTPGLSIKPNQSTNLKDESLPNGEAVTEGSADMSAEASPHGCMTEVNSLPVRSQEQSHADKKGFPSLVQILWPPFYNTPIAETRDIAVASRQAILQVATTILAENGLSDTNFPMESLCVGHGDSWYDMLNYEDDDIRDLLDGILLSEKVLRIKCVYAMKR
ncbi:conserved hypothetical protein [Aspergillus fumigatus A1163]|uniref:Uncharacterized protein n=1 Tax=Aspergillus fumigatus (strain CBS 144.89 / FGSC A1163 / CEA10) TaxID=451804 RepID=B0YB04_ASPFC|nr:conserved hypothetical protein [Aspergillus fumigatus A1163]